MVNFVWRWVGVLMSTLDATIVNIALPTLVQGGTFASGAAWCDNEMGYAKRLAEVAAKLAE